MKYIEYAEWVNNIYDLYDFTREELYDFFCLPDVMGIWKNKAPKDAHFCRLFHDVIVETIKKDNINEPYEDLFDKLWFSQFSSEEVALKTWERQLQHA